MIDLSRQNIVNRSFSGHEGATVLEVAKWVVLTGIIVVLLVTSVWIRDQILSMQYELENLAQENRKLSDQNDLLRVELNALTAPAVIEETAARLGLISATDSRVVILDQDELGGYPEAGSQIAQSDIQSRIMHE